MSLADLTSHDLAGVAIGLAVCGLLAMVVTPPAWHTFRGWAGVSFLLLPAALVVIAVLVAYPVLLFGALFLLGIYARR